MPKSTTSNTRKKSNTTSSKKKPASSTTKRKTTTSSAKRKPASKSKSVSNSKVRKEYNNEITGLLIGALGIFLLFCVFATTRAGILGSFFSGILFGLVGMFAYLVPFAFIVLGIFIIFTSDHRAKISNIVIWSVFTISFMSLIHIITMQDVLFSSFIDNVQTSYKLGVSSELLNKGGGAIASLIVYPIQALVGFPTSIVIYIVSMIIVIIIKTRLSIVGTSKYVGGRISEKVTEEREYRKNLFVEDIREEAQPKPVKKTRGRKQKTNDREITIFGDENFYDGKSSKKNDYMPEFLQEFEENKEKPIIATPPKKAAKPPIIVEEKKQPPRPKPKPKTPKIKIEGVVDEVKEESYIHPPIELLKRSNNQKTKNVDEYMAEADKLERTLRSFGVEAKVVQISRGPAITRYELQPAPGVKSKTIVNLANDIALNLAAVSVRIVAPIPGKAAIGVEVPNKIVSMVTLRDVLDTPEFENSVSDLSVAIGKDIAGTSMVSDLAKLPHLLIAGATGSGKSVCINSLIVSMLYKSSPKQVRMIMVDPKQVELSAYDGIPHLLIPVVTDPKKAAGALNWAVQEMLKRYKMFAKAKTRNLTNYNEIAQKNNTEKLPQIVIIIDELADLMSTAASEVEDAIFRLAQMARAAGMYLIIATQRPSVNVITGVIKANVPSRIAFKVSNATDSRVILDSVGAEQLLGKGDLLFHENGKMKPYRAQGAFISEEEVEAVVDFLKKDEDDENYDKEIEQNIEQLAKSETSDKAKEVTSNFDVLLPDAINVIHDQGQASISMIQRRLSVGYARAARIVDQMEMLEIVSPAEGSKPREILKSRGESLSLAGGKSDIMEDLDDI